MVFGGDSLSTKSGSSSIKDIDQSNAWRKRKGAARCKGYCAHILQELKLFLTVTPRNAHYEEEMGKRISQVALYSMADQVDELKQTLQDEREKSQELAVKLAAQSKRNTDLMARLEKIE